MDLVRTPIVLTALAALLALPAHAAERLNLTQAIATAIANNPELRAAERAIDAARAREVQAGAVPNPNLTLQADQVPFGTLGAGNYLAGVSQPLLFGDYQGVRVEAARLDTEVAALDRDVLRRDLEARVKDAYDQVLFEDEGRQLAVLEVQAARALLVAAGQRFQSGDVAHIEVMRAQVEVGRIEREVDAAAGRARQATGRLDVLLGRPADAPLEVATPPGAEVSLPPFTDLQRVAVASRAELRRAAAVIQREALQRQLAQGSVWTGTEVGLSGGSVAGQPGFSASLAVPIPIYRQQGAVAEAEANKLRAEAEREALRNNISLEVQEAYQDALQAARSLHAFGASYLPQAERLLDNARHRYQVGEGSAVEVFEARRALQETRTDRRRAVLAYRQAITKLERAIGAPIKP